MAAGNRKKKDLDQVLWVHDQTPQSIASEENSIIMVGGARANGELSIRGRPSNPCEAPISVYAPMTVECYNTQIKFPDGTSIEDEDRVIAKRDSFIAKKIGTSYSAALAVSYIQSSPMSN